MASFINSVGDGSRGRALRNGLARPATKPAGRRNDPAGLFQLPLVLADAALGVLDPLALLDRQRLRLGA